MKSRSIVFQRLKLENIAKLNLLRSVFDWTVIVYLVIPLLIFSVFEYKSWWNVRPHWWNFVSPPLFHLFVLSLYSYPILRSFLLQADRVYLLKHIRKVGHVRTWSLVYTIVRNLAMCIMMIILTAPLLIKHFSWDLPTILSFFCFYFGAGQLIQTIKLDLFRYKKYVWMIANSLFLLTTLSILSLQFTSRFVFMIGLILCGISIWKSLKEIARNTDFDLVIEAEELERHKLLNAVFVVSNDLQKQKINKKQRPRLFFRKSERLFKINDSKHTYLELFIKIVIRDSSYSFGYGIIYGFSFFAILILPVFWLKLVVATVFVVFSFLWAGFVFEQITRQHPYANQFSQKEGFFEARKVITTILTLCAVTLSLIAIGIYFFTLNH